MASGCRGTRAESTVPCWYWCQFFSTLLSGDIARDRIRQSWSFIVPIIIHALHITASKMENDCHFLNSINTAQMDLAYFVATKQKLGDLLWPHKYFIGHYCGGLRGGGTLQVRLSILQMTQAMHESAICSYTSTPTAFSYTLVPTNSPQIQPSACVIQNIKLGANTPIPIHFISLSLSALTQSPPSSTTC